MAVKYLGELGPHDLSGLEFGDVIVCRGHRFEYWGREPYVRKDGKASEVLVLCSNCHDCKAVYWVKVSERHTKDFRMRCDACKKPHVPVRPGRKRLRKMFGD